MACLKAAAVVGLRLEHAVFSGVEADGAAAPYCDRLEVALCLTPTTPNTTC